MIADPISALLVLLVSFVLNVIVAILTAQGKKSKTDPQTADQPKADASQPRFVVQGQMTIVPGIVWSRIRPNQVIKVKADEAQ